MASRARRLRKRATRILPIFSGSSDDDTQHAVPVPSEIDVVLEDDLFCSTISLDSSIDVSDNEFSITSVEKEEKSPKTRRMFPQKRFSQMMTQQSSLESVPLEGEEQEIKVTMCSKEFLLVHAS